MVAKGMFLCEWEDGRISFGTLKTAWATENQLDVRVMEITITKVHVQGMVRKSISVVIILADLMISD